jgi:hypothetical protein
MLGYNPGGYGEAKSEEEGEEEEVFTQGAF